VTAASTLIDQARTTLIDTSARTWAEDELFGYLRMGVNQACAALLDLYVTVVDHALDAGMRQYLPEGGLVLVDATTNGDGGPVTQQALAELARTQPEWRTATPGQPSFFIYDKRSPQTFMVWPPAGSGASLELVIGAMPPEFSSSDELPISAWFDRALWAFIVGMALAKNTQRQDLTKSALFMAMFDKDIAAWKAAKESTVSPPDVRGVH